MAGAAERIVVTGASGLLGRALAASTAVTALGRAPRPAGELWWEPARGVVHDDGAPIAAVVHLAGANLADGRWTAARRRELEDSRVGGTRALVDWLAQRPQRPAALVCASAVGFYGESGEQERDETAAPGRGFLAELCQRWEAEAVRAERAGLRVVRLRLGVVLSRTGGALAALEPLFRLGLGGPLGSGRQWFPWLHVDDAAQMLRFALDEPGCAGVYNAVAPGAVRQAEFARELGAALGRPARLPVPRFALRLALGAMADEALLVSQHVVPTRLRAAGFRFRHGELGAALRDLYGR
jgi:uncharacterized protein (TIGR01777 family)